MGYKPITPEQYEEGRRIGRERLANALRAESVRYDPVSDSVVIGLSDTLTFGVKRSAIHEWADIPAEEFNKVRLSAVRDAIALGDYHVHINIAGLLSEALPNAFLRVAFAKRGGAAKSPEKAAAARANGALGGRPRKVPVGMDR